MFFLQRYVFWSLTLNLSLTEQPYRFAVTEDSFTLSEKRFNKVPQRFRKRFTILTVGFHDGFQDHSVELQLSYKLKEGRKNRRQQEYYLPRGACFAAVFQPFFSITFELLVH